MIKGFVALAVMMVCGVAASQTIDSTTDINSLINSGTTVKSECKGNNVKDVSANAATSCEVTATADIQPVCIVNLTSPLLYGTFGAISSGTPKKYWLLAFNKALDKFLVLVVDRFKEMV